MKILIISSTFYPQIGGGENYILNLAIELGRRKHDVWVLTSAQTVKGIRRIDNVTVLYAPYMKIFGTEVISPFHMYNIIRKLKPDIIHGSGPSVSQDIGFFLSRPLKIPMLITYHADLDPNKTISRIYTKISTKTVLKRMQRVIVTSKKYFDILVERGVPQEKLLDIPVGVEFTKFTDAQNSNLIKDKLHLKEKKTMLFVGGLDRGHLYKRLDLLINSLVLVKRKIRNAYLVVVGRGEFISKYKNMVEHLGIQEDVSFQTDVSDDELPFYYSAADLFVLPSPTEREGFGLVLLEAMAAGIPVIASDKCGGAFAVENGQAGLLYRAYDVNDLSVKIIKILMDDELASKLGENGKTYAKSHDWKKISHEIELVYEELLTNRNK
jgi:glycosyltransferase involved in cell wall biosynthesis